MKKFLGLIAVFLALGTIAQGDPTHAQPGHDVLAHCSGDRAWYAHVEKSNSIGAVETPVSDEQTELFVRQNGPGEQWHELPELSGRAIALASRQSQLAVLMNDGQWFTVWAEGSATGQPLPADGRIKTIAGDGENLWAIGSVPGGIAAADAAVMRETASTVPTTTTVEVPPKDLSAVLTSPAKLVMFNQVNGRWAAVSELPGDAVIASQDDLSLAVVAGIPLVSFRDTSGGIEHVALFCRTCLAGCRVSQARFDPACQQFPGFKRRFQTDPLAREWKRAGATVV